MKLFIWDDPYPVQYGSSMVFAVAKDLETAKEIAMNAPGYAYTKYNNIPDKSKPLGEPVRVLELPCAEWHEWSE